MIHYYPELVQGSDEWRAARCGLLTASEMHLILTPTLKVASNDKERAHVYELLAQRITQYVEPSYIGDDMLRGMEDEIAARDLYREHCAMTDEMGFIVNDKWGFSIGYSPDGLVGRDGQIECKSRRQKFQIQTIACGEIPAEYILQLQTGLLVSEREWCDFISYSGGLPMFIRRVYPDEVVQNAIIEAASIFEGQVAGQLSKYRDAMVVHGYIPTERRVEQEMFT
jgi:predicted phage-related endonuclease